MFELTRKKKIGIILVTDISMIVLSCVLAYLFINPFLSINRSYMIILGGIELGLYIIFGIVFKVFTRINRYTNLNEIIAILSATTMTAITSILMILLITGHFSKRLVFFVYILSSFLIILSRLAWRLLIEQKIKHTTPKDRATKRTILIGAGAGGRIILNSFNSIKNNGEIQVVGFVDDDPNKKNIYLSNVKVLGTIQDLPDIIKTHNIDMVTIAIPSLPNKRLREIFSLLEDIEVKVTSMPSLEELASGRLSVEKLKQIDVVDLLGRDEVKLDIEAIQDQITNKTILVTGAGGSIGSEICRQIMKFNPKRLLLLGHGENSIYLINRELFEKYRKHTTEIVPIIADIQDRGRIFEIMAEYRPDIVYHAAAHKHVPLMEYNPREAIKNNVYGTTNVAEAAKSNDVEHFVMVSTDKANNPPNVMGATKRIAEMIVTSLNEEGKTNFSAVRFGNVLGSRGSVIPVFRDQIAKGGPVTVTDFRMTRFFMTIPEASRLVIQAGALAKGGEIFVLDMGEPVRIVDLAKNMIRLSGYSEDDIQIIETGIRPGEKLYEELLLDKERSEEQVHEKIFVGNIKGFGLNEVMEFVETLPEDKKKLAEVVVEFANQSNK
jgi:FlaA1/EpsC-like NDP-sugar epimerase